MLILIIASIILVALILWNKFKQVTHATNLKITYIGKVNNMETYLATWLPSTSTFVEKQQLWAGINGGTAAQILSDLSSSADSATVTFPTGVTVDLFVKTIGDNATTADSAICHFIAANLQAVHPASGLSVAWLSHAD
jgi:hypothetical protein